MLTIFSEVNGRVHLLSILIHYVTADVRVLMLIDSNCAHAEISQDQATKAERDHAATNRPTVRLAQMHEMHLSAEFVAVSNSLSNLHLSYKDSNKTD